MWFGCIYYGCGTRTYVRYIRNNAYYYISQKYLKIKISSKAINIKMKFVVVFYLLFINEYFNASFLLLQYD